MRYWTFLITLTCLLIFATAALFAQNENSGERALREAKARAGAAKERAESLRQEASNAGLAADRLVAQRAVLSAEIDAAVAQIDAANARIAIINGRERRQQARLGAASAPMLRLNGALLDMANRPTSMMIFQGGERRDYIRLRAVMETVNPAILQRTASLRQQIAVQKDLRTQELLALKSLGIARARLANQRTALVRLENSNRGRANSLTADAAAEFEQAIAQGERARDIIENLDSLRAGSQMANDLASLPGPVSATGRERRTSKNSKSVYSIPQNAKLIRGFNEQNVTGYRERGITIEVAPAARITAPASGKVSFAGPYRSYGRIVIIEHGGGWNTLITGLDALSVDVGAQVAQGEGVGNAPDANPAITFELRRNGRIMDIAALLF